MKQCHLIVWSVEKIQKVKNKMYKKKEKKNEEQCFYQDGKCVVVKILDLSKTKK